MGAESRNRSDPFSLSEQVQLDNARELSGWGPAARWLSRVIRLCLRFGVTPVFIPKAEPNRRQNRITRDRERAAGPQPHSSRALSNWTCSGIPRSFPHSPRNHRTSSLRREPTRRRQTAPSKASLPTQM